MFCSKRLAVFGVVLALAGGLIAPAAAQGLSPLTWGCLTEASERFRVPLAMMVAILATEGGQIGRVSRNTNGTYDIGPMQINSRWLPVLRDVGISEMELRDYGCVNVAVAAWLLRSLLAAHGTPQGAISAYHSRDPQLAAKYLGAVKRRAYTLQIDQVIARANGDILQGRGE